MKLLKILKKGVLVAALLIVIAAVVLNNVTIIPTGYTGVRVKFGQVQQQPVRSALRRRRGDCAGGTTGADLKLHSAPPEACQPPSDSRPCRSL